MKYHLFETTAQGSSYSTDSSFSATDKLDSDSDRAGRKGRSLGFRIRDHVKLGSKFSETMKGKLGLGAAIVREGGRKNIFKQVFGMSEGEELLKASQCYLSTTAGPIAGLLFVSTAKVAFCSERKITLPLPSGEFHRTPCRVVIPTKKIRRANESENAEEAAQKYIEISTEDGFQFWFMGFLRFEKALLNLRNAISLILQNQNRRLSELLFKFQP